MWRRRIRCLLSSSTNTGVMWDLWRDPSLGDRAITQSGEPSVFSTRWSATAAPVTIELMRTVAIISVVGGLVLGVRVMFFGVQRRVSEERLTLQRWPLALAVFFMAAGSLLYLTSADGTPTNVW